MPYWNYSLSPAAICPMQSFNHMMCKYVEKPQCSCNRQSADINRGQLASYVYAFATTNLHRLRQVEWNYLQ